jgi:regulator of PEP synthase PpsR (kinase-PPPase family)
LKKDEIYIVSDATGETAEKLIFSALVQFKKDSVEIQKFTKINTPEQIKDIVKKATHTGAFIVYTLAQKWLRDLMVRESEACKVNSYDLLGPVIGKFSQYLAVKPEERPGAQHIIDADYFKRIDAIEFTVKHDDGRNQESTYDADIILFGVSRTSKTPLSIYLAHESWKVANVPFVPGVTYNIEFSRLTGKAIGLVIDPVYLVDIRKERLRHIGKDINGNYASLKTVYEEINLSIEFYKKNKIPTVSVTKKSIEEIALEILKTLRKDRTKY